MIGMISHDLVILISQSPPGNFISGTLFQKNDLCIKDYHITLGWVPIKHRGHSDWSQGWPD